MAQMKRTRPAKYDTKTTRAAAVTRAMRALGKIGGVARAAKLSPERRREIAIKASRAAAASRSKKLSTEQEETRGNSVTVIRDCSDSVRMSDVPTGSVCRPQVDPSLDLMRFFKSEQLPPDLENFCTLRRTLDARLAGSFRTTLTDTEARIYAAKGLESPLIRRKWDESIINAAARYGTLILLSDLVLRRVHAWRTGIDASGPQLRILGRFLTVILEEAAVRSGQKQDPITEECARYKPLAVAELRKLQGELRRSALQKPQDVARLVEKLLSAEQYPGLCANRTALLVFLEQNPWVALGFGAAPEPLFTDGGDPVEQVSATDFFYRFVAHSTNRDPEAVRQLISKLSAGIKRREA
jgi:hypothetical protein